MSNTVNISRRYKAKGFVRIEPSDNDPDLLFVSTPNIIELTEEEAHNLIQALTEEANKLWGNK